MSDYEYQEQYQYEDPQEQQNIETKVELQYLQIEDLIRRNQWAKAIQQLESLYITSQENKLKSYKIKILNQLLQIYCKNSDINHIRTTISRITQLNKQEKYSQNSIKFIINLMRTSDYQKIHSDVFNFINELGFQLKLKSYMLLLDKAIDQKDYKQAQNLFDLVSSHISQTQNPSASILVEFYSLQIKYSKFTGEDINDKIHEMELKIPTLENAAYMSQGHISVLKLAIAEIMYEYGNYENSTLYLAEVFLQKAKYGNSSQLKQYLKTNVLLSLLIQNLQLRKDQKYNTLFNQISIPFKNQKDVQALISLVDSYEKHDLELFKQNYASINFKPESERYLTIYEKLLFSLKKEKLIVILKSYKTIKYEYIARRLDLSWQYVQKIIFQLIVDDKIRGRIFDNDPSNKYLEILPPKNDFLEIQAENLRELSKRYLSL